MGAESSRLLHVTNALQSNSVDQLDLQGACITDLATKKLARSLELNKSCTSLNLSRNLVRDEGAMYLAQMLCSNRTLLCLNLSWNAIGDDGAQAFSNALSRNTTLKELNLFANRVGDFGGFSIERALGNTFNSSLVAVNLEYNGLRSGLLKRVKELVAKNLMRIQTEEVPRAQKARRIKKETPNNVKKEGARQF